MPEITKSHRWWLSVLVGVTLVLVALVAVLVIARVLSVVLTGPS